MAKAAPKEAKGGASPSQLIDARIKALGDWRGETLARVRALIKEADPRSGRGGEMAKAVERDARRSGVGARRHHLHRRDLQGVVKLTFARGAALEDPSGLFNSSLEGNVRRAIDIHEGDKIDEKALKALIRAAVALNTAKRAAARPALSEEIKARLRNFGGRRHCV